MTENWEKIVSHDIQSLKLLLDRSFFLFIHFLCHYCVHSSQFEKQCNT